MLKPLTGKEHCGELCKRITDDEDNPTIEVDIDLLLPLVAFGLNDIQRPHGQALLEDIKKNGITTPLIVRCAKPPYEGKYRVRDGNHRLVIAKYLGIKKIKCKVSNERISWRVL